MSSDLRAVADRLFRRGMHFQNYPSARSPRPRAKAAGTSSVSRGHGSIQNNRQVVIHSAREFGRMSQVLRVTVSKVRMPPSLAQNHFGFSVRRDVFGDHQAILSPCCLNPASAAPAARHSLALQQHKILHVPRAHLHHVPYFATSVHITIAHHFRNDRQPRRLLAFRVISSLLLPVP